MSRTPQGRNRCGVGWSSCSSGFSQRGSGHGSSACLPWSCLLAKSPFSTSSHGDDACVFPFPAVPAHFKLFHPQGSSAVLSHDPHEPKCKMTEFPTICLSGNPDVSNPGLKERGMFYALAQQSLLPLLQPLIAP